MKTKSFLISVCIIFSSSLLYGEPFLWRDVQTWTKGLSQALSHPSLPTEEGKVPTQEERALLEQFKPRLFIAPGADAPIDFYSDYLPHTVVRRTTEQKLIQERSPGRDRLKEIMYDPEIYLEYTEMGRVGKSSPKVYSELARETVNLNIQSLITTREFIFLKYHFVFTYGGLPTQLSSLKEDVFKLLGDPAQWRQLEHSSIYIVLDDQLQIVAVMLRQYDYFRTFLRGEQLQVPSDGHVAIAFSERSNQPYLLHKGQHPIQRFASLDFRDIPYVIGGKEESRLGGIDLVYPIEAGGVEISYDLEFLPEFDPLYISRIPLGKRAYYFDFLENPFRRGSIGMDFVTWPQVMDLGNILQFWYIRDGDLAHARFMHDHMRGFFDTDFEEILKKNTEIFGLAFKKFVMEGKS